MGTEGGLAETRTLWMRTCFHKPDSLVKSAQRRKYQPDKATNKNTNTRTLFCVYLHMYDAYLPFPPFR